MELPASDVFIRLGLATLLGGIIGVERESRQKPAGLRTNILITLGSAVFSMLSLEIGTDAGSPDRVAAQIVTGIGFLGAGAIMQRGTDVQGLTTAATIWVNAAIGMAAGVGSFTLAMGSTAVALITLTALGVIERQVEKRKSAED